VHKTLALKDNERLGKGIDVTRAEYDAIVKIRNVARADSAYLVRSEGVVGKDLSSTGPFIDIDIDAVDTTGWDGDKKRTVWLRTYNLVGVLTYKDVTVEVGSRFDNGSKQQFLIAMLHNAFAVYPKDLSAQVNTEGPLTIMLIIALAHYLEVAWGQGLPRQYVERSYNNSAFRGRLDLTAHLKHNIPFQGRIAHRSSEYSHDNPLLWLIRCCLDTIDVRYPGIWNQVTKGNSGILSARRAIIESTPSYARFIQHDLAKVCVKPITHPLYSAYEPVRRVCCQILQEEGVSPFDGQEEDEVKGILFDCAWLWESFVYRRLLSRRSSMGFSWLDKTLQKEGLRIFQDNPSPSYYPDFLSLSKRVVFDAKYKVHLQDNNSLGGCNSDIYQVTTYLFLNSCRIGGLVYPADDGKPCRRYFYERKGDEKLEFWYLPFSIPDTSSDNFFAEFEERCEKWIADLEKSIG